MHRQPQANSCSQPTAWVANQDGCKPDVVPVDQAPRSYSRPNQAALIVHIPGGRKSSPLQIVRRLLARPADCPRRDTFHTVAYNDHEANQDEDGQQITESFHLSNDSSNEYKNSHISNQSELDSEPDTDDNDNADDTTLITCHQSWVGEKETNNRVSTVWILTTGLQEAAIGRHTSAARARIIRSSVYTPQAISAFGV